MFAALAHRVVERVLAVRTTPPDYVGITVTLADMLAELHEERAKPLVRKAAGDLADVQGATPAARTKAIRARMDELAAALTADGSDLGDEAVDRIGASLAAAFRLGKVEIATELAASGPGPEIGPAWTLPDQDALAGLHRSGLFWIGQHYGDGWTCLLYTSDAADE